MIFKVFSLCFFISKILSADYSCHTLVTTYTFGDKSITDMVVFNFL